tara:strand:+ start:41 stop:253 length:213 start_codon:yes stop_codon:yes gene_type:complete
MVNGTMDGIPTVRIMLRHRDIVREFDGEVIKKILRLFGKSTGSVGCPVKIACSITIHIFFWVEYLGPIMD